MRKVLAVILSLAMLLSVTACGAEQTAQANDADETYISASGTDTEDDEPESVTDDSDEGIAESDATEENPELDFPELDDAELLLYVENTVYSDLIDQLEDGEYFVENVSATYISKEYLEEVAYNSQANIYFGYTLEELEDESQGTKFVFTLGDDGTTTVQAFEDYDDTYDQIVRNVAVGTGVILVCVTVSAVSGGVGAPAVSMIFAASAKTGTTVAVSSGLFSGVAAGIITGIQTEDFDEAIKAAELAASEGFKWGAISGAVLGGASEAVGLYGATLNGLTMNEAAIIQKESKWPLEAIKALHSTAEYDIYKAANLTPTLLDDGTWIFLRSDIDWSLTDAYGRTNIQRVQQYLAPIDSTGKSYELHHIGQMADSPLAVLSYTEHHSSTTYSILHYAEEGKDITDVAWAAQKRSVWNAILTLAESGG
ncbi:MAG: HNH/ENDO VII family nuclease [Clostridiales bacterium]|nr:HNH/ENDO VII family nuclease [Clostridiales bacterium]